MFVDWELLLPLLPILRLSLPLCDKLFSCLVILPTILSEAFARGIGFSSSVSTLLSLHFLKHDPYTARHHAQKKVKKWTAKMTKTTPNTVLGERIGCDKGSSVNNKK